MPENRYQAYAVVYEGQGQFLLARKLAKGYFFHDKGGRIVKAGQNLNGGGKYALPGGKKEPGASYLDTAEKEFREETGQALTGRYDKVALPGAPWDGGLSRDGRTHFYYIAAYFKVSPQTLSTLITTITRQNLPASRQVVDAIVNGTKVNNITIGRYSDIKRAAPLCPEDNELDTVDPWDLLGRWGTIDTWKTDGDLGWYYTVLKYLKDNILKI